MWFSLRCYIHNTLWTYLLQLFLSHCYVYNMGYKYNNISDEIQQCYIHNNLWTYLLQLLLSHCYVYNMGHKYNNVSYVTQWERKWLEKTESLTLDGICVCAERWACFICNNIWSMIYIKEHSLSSLDLNCLIFFAYSVIYITIYGHTFCKKHTLSSKTK